MEREVGLRTYRHEARALAFREAAHDELELAWVDGGAARYRLGTREHLLAAGDAIVVPPRLGHATTLLPGLRATSLKLAHGLVDGVAAAMGASCGREAVHLRAAEGIVALGRRLRAERARRAPGRQLVLDALAEAIAVEALRPYAHAADPRPSRDPRLAAALELIREHHDRPLTVAELARAAGLSRYHFSRVFRAQLGTSPYRYLQRVRVERARELLRGGRRTVAEAATEVGFSDLGRFARAFRTHVGCLPSELRRRGA